MKKTLGKYCAIAREDAGFTQEATETVLLVSARSVSAYERGETLPPADIVMLMIEKFNAPWLGYQYLRCNEVGQALLPDVPINRNLSASILDLQVEMDDVINSQNALAKVGRDDTITENEHPIFDKCKCEILEFIGAAFSVITAQKRKTPVIAHRRN